MKKLEKVLSKNLFGWCSSMAENNILLSSRIILAQVLGRVCFPQNHAALLCEFKARQNHEDPRSVCEDEHTEMLDCQREM